MTITDMGTNVQSNYASGSGTSTLTWTPPTPAVGDLHILSVLSGRPVRYGPVSTVSDLAGWTPVYDVVWDDFFAAGWLRRSRAWIRYYESGDANPSVTCSGMKAGNIWGGELTALRGPAGGLASVTLSHRPTSSTNPWTATDPGGSAAQVNVLLRHAAHAATTGSWVPDASWDGGHKREIAPPGSTYLAYREGPASPGTVSLTAPGTENDYCHILTIDMVPTRNGWAVGRLAW